MGYSNIIVVELYFRTSSGITDFLVLHMSIIISHESFVIFTQNP